MLYAIAYAPAIGGALDRALLILSAATLVQLLPLPGFVSPEAVRVRTALSLTPYLEPTWGPLTIHVPHTAAAAIKLLGAGALFFAARERFATGGVRRAVRAIAAIGLGVSLLAIAQSATAGRSIYWLFETEHEGPLPLGPFVNRNHFATWAIMAIPLCLGYTAAHARAHRSSVRPGGGPLGPALPRLAGLVVSFAALSAALVLSLSRSAAAGLGIAGLITLVQIRRALMPAQVRRLVVAIAALLV